MRYVIAAALLGCAVGPLGCSSQNAPPSRPALQWSGWIEDAAARRGHIAPGDFAQFGCPPGWVGVGDTAAALRGQRVGATYMGTSPPPREGTLTCVAQREFALPPAYPSQSPERDSIRRPLTPVWLAMAPDRVTIGFAQDLMPSTAVFIGQDTPCGPRLFGVRLGDLLKWLADPQSATTRDFLGLITSRCPDPVKP